MKQELLKWIYENKVGLGTVETVYMDDLIEMINELEEPQVTNEQAWNKIAETYPETAQNLRITLDHAVYGHEAEPQKVKVPAYVAEWFEINKEQLEVAIWDLTTETYETDRDQLSEIQLWIKESDRPYKTLISMQDGYEVEEEPKYYVNIGDLYLKEPLGDTSDFTISMTWNREYAYPFDSWNMAREHASKLGGTVEKAEE